MPVKNNKKVKVYCKLNDGFIFHSNDKEEIQNQKYHIFSASDEIGQLVVASQNPIKNRLISTYFKKDSDFNSIKESFLQSIQTYQYDAVFNMHTNVQRLFKSICKPQINKLFKGINSSVLLQGPSNSGKSFHFRGNEQNDRGLLYRSIEEILTQMKINQQQGLPKKTNQKYEVYVSFYAIFYDEVIDLLGSESQNNIQIKDVYEKTTSQTKIIGLKKNNIQNLPQFEEQISVAYQNLNTYIQSRQSEQNLRHQVHIACNIDLIQQTYEQEEKMQDYKISRLLFVRLSDEINHDLQVLSKYLIHCSNNTDIQIESKIFKESKLTFCLRDSLNEQTNIISIMFVSPNPVDFNETIKSLEYGSKLCLALQQNESNQEIEVNNPHPYNSIYSMNKSPNYNLFNDKSPSSNQQQSGNKRFYVSAQKSRPPTSSNKISGQNILIQNSENQSGVKDPYVDNIRDKEQKINEDYQNLMNKFNRSKNLIENFAKLNRNQSFDGRSMPQAQQNLKENQFQINSNNSTPSVQLQTGQNVQVNDLEKDIIQLKKNIIQKIQQSEIKERVYSPNHSPTLKPMSQKQIYDDTLDMHPVSLTPRMMNNVNIEDKPKGALNNNLKKLQQTIKVRENLEKEKILQLKYKNDEFKKMISQHLEKIEFLEQSIDQKQELIQQQDQTIQQQNDILVQLDESLREYKLREDGLLKNEDELRDLTLHLKTRLVDKKKKIKELQDSLADKTDDFKIKLQQLNENCQQLQQKLQVQQSRGEEQESRIQDQDLQIQNLNQQLTKRDQSILKLNEDLLQQTEALGNTQNQLQQEQQSKIEMRHQFERQISKYDEDQMTIKNLENKILRNKQKFEEEKNQIINAHKDETQKLRKKKSNYKSQTSAQQEKLQTQNEHITSLKNQQEILNQKLEQLNKENDQFKQENHEFQQRLLQLGNNHQNEQQSKNVFLKNLEQEQLSHNETKQENEKLNKIIENLEKKILGLEESQQQDFRSINDYKGQIAQLQDNNINLKEYVTKLETQLEFMTKQQNEEISHFEQRLESVIEEMRQLKEENLILKQTEGELKRLVQSTDEQAQTFKDKYLQQKFNNKSLKNHIREIEDKVKQYMTERQIEQREIAINKENAQKLMSTKLKTLDEIQYLIKNHRFNSTSSKTEYLESAKLF